VSALTRRVYEEHNPFDRHDSSALTRRETSPNTLTACTLLATHARAAGGLDIVVNNAGVYEEHNPFDGQ
jgi:NAD(P)-dependent dehydrogenase (short-subunit alcohol dehydrogenase family)